MTLPFDSKNPDKALTAMKIGTHGFFSQNNDLMDMVVVAEKNNTKPKNHQAMLDESLKIDPKEYMEEESTDSASKQP